MKVRDLEDSHSPDCWVLGLPVFSLSEPFHNYINGCQLIYIDVEQADHIALSRELGLFKN